MLDLCSGGAEAPSAGHAEAETASHPAGPWGGTANSVWPEGRGSPGRLQPLCTPAQGAPGKRVRPGAPEGERPPGEPARSFPGGLSGAAAPRARAAGGARSPRSHLSLYLAGGAGPAAISGRGAHPGARGERGGDGAGTHGHRVPPPGPPGPGAPRGGRRRAHRPDAGGAAARAARPPPLVGVQHPLPEPVLPGLPGAGLLHQGGRALPLGAPGLGSRSPLPTPPGALPPWRRRLPRSLSALPGSPATQGPRRPVLAWPPDPPAGAQQAGAPRAPS